MTDYSNMRTVLHLLCLIRSSTLQLTFPPNYYNIQWVLISTGVLFLESTRIEICGFRVYTQPLNPTRGFSETRGRPHTTAQSLWMAEKDSFPTSTPKPEVFVWPKWPFGGNQSCALVAFGRSKWVPLFWVSDPRILKSPCPKSICIQKGVVMKGLVSIKTGNNLQLLGFS